MFLFLKAFGLGIALAAPLGPIAVLCIRFTLTHGFTSGLVIGMGAATADGIYAALASFGINTVTQLLIGVNTYFRPLGGILLCYIGIRFLWTKEYNDNIKGIYTSSHFSNYSKTVFLTLANPLTIVTFLGVVSALDIESSTSSAFFITMGMLLGSALWHILLVSCASTAKKFLKHPNFYLINVLSGSILVGVGISMLIT